MKKIENILTPQSETSMWSMADLMAFSRIISVSFSK